ncbi:MAG TPA: hypothetical protein VNN77_01510 [candidate division Zixibacteria bacterium]|nr:hypothetical protein [candidate division Zixibacteria bacterium]
MAWEFADENMASGFQPDTVPEVQYFSHLRRKTVLEGEKKLMFAILKDAIDCYRNNVSARHGKRKRLFDETENWIVQSDSNWIFSFETICDALGLNPEYVRQGLFRWKCKVARTDAVEKRTTAEGGRIANFGSQAKNLSRRPPRER